MRFPIRLAFYFAGGMFFLLLGALPGWAQANIDRTCATCSRKKNDSLNLQVRAIRLNQVGYVPQDPDKAAIVADAASQTFTVLDLAGRNAVMTGSLKPVGTRTGGAIKIRGAY